MDMQSQDARNNLDLIQQVQTRVQAQGRRGVGGLLVVWGLVWLTVFGISQWAPAGWRIGGWLLAGAVGAAFSAVIGLRLGTAVPYTQTGPKLGRFYAALLLFVPLWLLLARPESGAQMAVLSVTFLGFGLVVSGLLLQVRGLWLGGLVLTVLVVLIFLLLPAQFGLLLALGGGGGMCLAGLWFLYKGASHG